MKWVTRSHVHVDRVACPWLITRFVDNEAEFLFVPKNQVDKIAAETGAIPFDAPDGKPVSQFMTFLVPAQSTERHLQLLANVSELFSDRGFREQLGKCTEPGTVCRLFAAWPESFAAIKGASSGGTR